MKLSVSCIKSSIDFKKISQKKANFKSLDLLEEKYSSMIVSKNNILALIDSTDLFKYNIFPSYIMGFKAQWIVEKRTMQVDDIIHQRVFFPPLGFGICMEFSVRITEIFTGNKVGFAYETLEGHVEKGLSEFYFQQKGTDVVFVIHTYSSPAYKLLALTKYIVALPYQKWSTYQALKNTKYLLK